MIKRNDIKVDYFSEEFFLGQNIKGFVSSFELYSKDLGNIFSNHVRKHCPLF